MLLNSHNLSLKLKKNYRKTLYQTKKIPLIKRIFPKPHANSVRIEICGSCNAKCLFCHSGNVPFDKEKIISPKSFDDTLYHLKKINLLTKNVYLYDRGEPFMHKEIGNILDICRQHGLNALMSTNASRVPDLTNDQWKTIKVLKVSMSGITEKSYKLIYGLNVRQVRRNVEKIARHASTSCDLRVNWLKYTFNREEEKEARRWLESLGFNFRDKLASLIQMEKLIDLKEKRISESELDNLKNYLLLDEKKNVSLNQLLLDNVSSGNIKTVDNFVCFQWDHIIIHNDGELLKCCSLSPFYPENRLGNIMELNADEIKRRKYEMTKTCNKCIKYGFAIQTKDVYSKIWRA